MRATKTIRCKVWNATKSKQDALNHEYNHLQAFLQEGEDKGIYSATKQQAKRYYKQIKKGKQYPISLRRDVIRVERRDTKLVRYWIRVPVHDIRGVRRHFAWLRKRLGEKKLLKQIKDLGQKERRIVNAYLHEISRGIVSVARNLGSIIVLGNLKGIRSTHKAKGKRFNRIVASMPYYKLTEMIRYKAAWG